MFQWTHLNCNTWPVEQQGLEQFAILNISTHMALLICIPIALVVAAGLEDGEVLDSGVH